MPGLGIARVRRWRGQRVREHARDRQLPRSRCNGTPGVFQAGSFVTGLPYRSQAWHLVPGTGRNVTGLRG